MMTRELRGLTQGQVSEVTDVSSRPDCHMPPRCSVRLKISQGHWSLQPGKVSPIVLCGIEDKPRSLESTAWSGGCSQSS